MRYNNIPNELFIRNRQKLSSRMEKSSVAIVSSNDQMPRSGDLFYTYRQNSDLIYLSGIEQEKTILLIYNGNDAPQYREALFIIRPDYETEVWQGKKLTIDEARSISGIENVYYLDQLDDILYELLSKANFVYLNRNGNDRFSSPVVSHADRFRNEFVSKYKFCKYSDMSEIMQSLRMIKEPEEIALMREACNITRIGFEDLLHRVHDGMREYEAEAILTYNFMANGANGHAFNPIVASGSNSCYLHYDKNDRTMHTGEILFIDFGAEYGNYAADCSRAIPVGGKFSSRQREVYDAVLRILKETRRLIVAGNTIEKYHNDICLLLQDELVNLGLLTKKDIDNAPKCKPAYRRYFMHGVSHYIGLDTHDLGSKKQILQDGMVVSCEPGIYIPEEGFGIRLENDILINGFRPIDLTSEIPIEADEIEKIMTNTSFNINL